MKTGKKQIASAATTPQTGSTPGPWEAQHKVVFSKWGNTLAVAGDESTAQSGNRAREGLTEHTTTTSEIVAKIKLMADMSANLHAIELNKIASVQYGREPRKDNVSPTYGSIKTGSLFSLTLGNETYRVCRKISNSIARTVEGRNTGDFLAMLPSEQVDYSRRRELSSL